MGPVQEFIHCNAQLQILGQNRSFPSNIGYKGIIPEKFEVLRLAGSRIGNRPHGYHYIQGLLDCTGRHKVLVAAWNVIQ
ncbi:hypothetical protein C6A77_13650 [Pseudomonas sp. AFG_SD02_1510_Pfu_092]|nr:hypothetical protein C6A77_13650 [Pseudomonas sp. AFG_SD02_1510_Pfu_092]